MNRKIFKFVLILFSRFLTIRWINKPLNYDGGRWMGDYVVLIKTDYIFAMYYNIYVYINTV